MSCRDCGLDTAGLCDDEQNCHKSVFDDIRQWGVDKGLIGDNGKATIVSQMGKLAEEYGELCTAIIERDESGVQDGIGDCAVVLVLLAELCGLRFEDCVESAYREIRGRTGVMVDGVFVRNPEAEKEG